jgi:hypothetical protein
LDELIASARNDAADTVRALSFGRRPHGPHRRLEQRRETGKPGGVDCVGLGLPIDSLGKAAATARIDVDQRQAGRGQAALEGVVIGAGVVVCIMG